MHCNNILANITSTFHVCLIIFVLIVPFLNIPSLLFIHFSLCLSLLIHWLANSDVCSLSIIESQLRGIDYTQSFTHRFVSPMYSISSSDWSTICYIITILLLCITVYKIYQSGRFSKTIDFYNKLDKSNSSRTEIYMKCLHTLLY
jgi:hypothetical protein